MAPKETIRTRLTAPAYAQVDSVREFKTILSGQTRTKPKYLMHPKSGELYRLVLREDGTRPFYEELPLDADTIHHMSLSPEAMEECKASTLTTLPQPYAIHSFRSGTASPRTLPEIRFSQLHSILAALGRPYRWSLTEFAQGDTSRAPIIANLLYKGDRIVGICGWDKSEHRRKNKPASVAFFLLAPNERGQGLGKHLLQFTQHQMLDAGVGAISLTTSNSCTSGNESCVSEFYEHQGYQTTESFEFDYERFKKGASETPVTMPEAFFRDPATGEELPRFQQARLDAQLDRVSKALLPTTTRER